MISNLDSSAIKYKDLGKTPKPFSITCAKHGAHNSEGLAEMQVPFFVPSPSPALPARTPSEPLSKKYLYHNDFDFLHP